MRVLSLTATRKLAERFIRHADEPVAVADALRWLEALDVERSRAEAGIRLGCIAGRLEQTTDDQGRPCLRIPGRGSVLLSHTLPVTPLLSASEISQNTPRAAGEGGPHD